MAKQISQIVIDDRFFEVGAAQSSRYSRLWTIAKETMQNSQDAKAPIIEFDVVDDWVTVTDYGPGMAKTGGIDNFLRIGASEKNQNGSATGFFSTAKVRICFIHKDWQIHTNNEFLSKSMLGNEPIRQGGEFFDGCSIRVQNKDGDWNATKVSDYVGLCNPEIKVQLNGRTVKRSYRKGSLKANYAWADIYVNRGQKASHGLLVVRVNGLAMFTQRLPNVKAQVTVELDPKMSHRILQENREALVWSAKYDDGNTFYPSHELDNFVAGLITNPSSAKPKDKTVIEFVPGQQRAFEAPIARFNQATGEAELNASRNTIKVAGQVPMNLTMEDLIALLEAGKLEQTAGPSLEPAELNDGREVVFFSARGGFGEHMAEYIEELPDGCTFERTDGVDTPLGKGQVVSSPVTDKFAAIFPYDYVIKHESNRPVPHTKHARILVAWKALTEKVAEVAEVTSPFGVGLCVDQEAKAEFTQTDGYGDFILVDYREFKLTGSQLSQTIKMARYAVHEMTHAMGYSDHNEAFIAAESELFDRCLERMSEMRACTKGLTVYSRGYGKS